MPEPENRHATWQQAWEEAVCQGNPILRDFARGSATRLAVSSWRESQGRVHAVVTHPTLRTVRVDLSLPQWSLTEWQQHLFRLAIHHPRASASLWDRPDVAVHAALAGMGRPVLPQGLQDIRTRVSAATGQTPCPCVMAAVIETGWMIELDPWRLFALRGLSREAAEKCMQQIRTPTTSISGSASDFMSPPAPEVSGYDRGTFWGHARAIRTFKLDLDPAETVVSPAVLLGPPPVDSEKEREMLTQLVASLYAADLPETK